MSLPTGTVTFVFTDIEGSTSLLKRLGDAEYATLLTVHRRLVRDIFAAHEGEEIDTQGDAFFYSFERARQAVAAAVELQRAHAKATWPSGVEVRVRLGLHTGEPAVGDEGYTGLDVVRAARIAAVGAGGQVLLSDTTRAIVAGGLPEDVSVRALGDRRLKDIDRPEPLFELRIEDLAATEGPERAEETDVAAEADAVMSGPSAARTAHEPPSPFRDLIHQARQRIESRVLAELEQSLGAIGAPDPDRPRPPRPPGDAEPRREERPRGRRARPADSERRSVAQEIARLDDLRGRGALTDEQYARAVDRLLDEPEPQAGSQAEP